MIISVLVFVCLFVSLFVCLSVYEQDDAKSSLAVFMKPCRIMDCCCGKTFYNGGAIWRIGQNIFRPHSLGGARVLRIV